MKQNRKGYWISEEKINFNLEKPIDDVEVFGNSLLEFLRWQKKEGNLPFEIKDLYPLYVDRRFINKRGAYWKTGYIVLIVKRRALKSYFNPLHDKLRGDESLILEFDDKGNRIEAYQELKYEYAGKKITWKLKLEQIQGFRELIEKFCAGYWLGINTLLK